MKIAFMTYVSDCFFHSMGGYLLVKSSKYFHPEIPMIVYGDKDINPLHIKFGLLHPFMINKAMNEGYDVIIYFDADSIITGPLTELLEALSDSSIDIVGVRNNNDYDRAGMDEPIGQDGAGTTDYLNAGLVATRNKQFVETWMDWNLLHGNSLPFMEQSVLNVLKCKYKTLMIDAKEADVYYGVSCLSGTETHWDSWKDIEVVDGVLRLNNKTIKVLHQAGGKKLDKLGFYMFNAETRNRLIEITGL